MKKMKITKPKFTLVDPEWKIRANLNEKKRIWYQLIVLNKLAQRGKHIAEIPRLLRFCSLTNVY